MLNWTNRTKTHSALKKVNLQIVAIWVTKMADKATLKRQTKIGEDLENILQKLQKPTSRDIEYIIGKGSPKIIRRIRK